MERLSCLISGLSMIFFCRTLYAAQLLLYEINFLCFGFELSSCYVHSLCYDVKLSSYVQSLCYDVQLRDCYVFLLCCLIATSFYRF